MELFGDIREMTKKAKKFDELKDTVMEKLPDDVKREGREETG